jgi:hypothetical protein
MSDTIELERRLLRLERTLEALAARERVGAAAGALASPGVVYVASDGTLKTEAAFTYIEASDELRTGQVRLPEQATPSNPAANFALLFAGNSGVNDGVPSGVDTGGTVYQMVRYATGTFTPTIVGSTTPGTFTYSVNAAQYTRIGDRVMFNGRIAVTATAVAPVGSVTINGFPFTSGANSSNGNILGAAWITSPNINFTAGYTQINGIIIGATNTMRIYETGDNVATNNVLQGAQFGATFDIFFVGWYKVD